MWTLRESEFNVTFQGFFHIFSKMFINNSCYVHASSDVQNRKFLKILIKKIVDNI